MATLTASPARVSSRSGNRTHGLLVSLAALASAGFVTFLAAYGAVYYASSLEDRAISPLHSQLRSSGTIGLKLGMLGVLLFGIIFLYPLRKRWKRLASLGTTRHWLDFHVILGITAPIVVTFHSTFHTQGIAGLAYWIMITVALSGFIGRYVYAQIPQSIHTAKLSMSELREQISYYTANISHHEWVTVNDIESLFRLPPAEEIRKMRLLRTLAIMLRADLARPFLIGRLRRHALRRRQQILTFGGILASRDEMLEAIISGARRQSRLQLRMAFLERTERVFHLWHIVHRPFSLSFVALILIHIGVVLLLGYY